MLMTEVSILNFVEAKTQILEIEMSKKPILLLFGGNVQKYRIAKGLSQEKLAELAGVHRTYIGMIERAEKNITLCNIERIAVALNISITKLLEE